MLQSAQYNRNRKNTDLKFYEFGRVYRSVKNGFEETEMLGMLMLGNATHRSRFLEDWKRCVSNQSLYHG
jgi:phenylalanyl-tRNA synthetase beta chain